MQLLTLDAMSKTVYNASSVYKKDKTVFNSLLAQAMQAAEKLDNNSIKMLSRNTLSPEQPKQAETTTTTTNIASTVTSSELPQEVLPPHQKYDCLIAAAGEKYGIEPALLKGLIKTESNFNETARSREGALGLVQLMPATARSMGVNPLNAEEAIEGGAKYLSQMLNRYNGNREMALAAYNAGPGNVDRYGGVPPFRETVLFIKRVTQNAINFKNDFQKFVVIL